MYFFSLTNSLCLFVLFNASCSLQRISPRVAFSKTVFNGLRVGCLLLCWAETIHSLPCSGQYGNPDTSCPQSDGSSSVHSRYGLHCSGLPSLWVWPVHIKCLNLRKRNCLCIVVCVCEETIFLHLSSINAGFVKGVARPDYWIPDHEITQCHCCAKPFIPSMSKHHCRACGQGVCGNCSSKTRPVPSRGWDHPVRVCNGCADRRDSLWPCCGCVAPLIQLVFLGTQNQVAGGFQALDGVVMDGGNMKLAAVA